jgi:hypothetical protein
MMPSVNTLNPKRESPCCLGKQCGGFLLLKQKFHPPRGLVPQFFRSYNKQERCPGIAGTTPGLADPNPKNQGRHKYYILFCQKKKGRI